MTPWRSFYQTRSRVRIKDGKRLGTPSLPNCSWPSYIVAWFEQEVDLSQKFKSVHLHLGVVYGSCKTRYGKRCGREHESKRIVMEKKLIHGNELKGAKHGMEDNMIRQTSVYMCIPNHACTQVHACGYQTKLPILLQRMLKSYEKRLLIEVESSLLDVCFPFIILEFSWFDIKGFVAFKA